MQLQGKKVAVLAENMYDVTELTFSQLRIKEAGADVMIVGPRSGETYTSKHGDPIKSDLSAADVTANEFDAIIIPGGFAPDYMRRHESMVKLVRDAANSGRVVAAICHAGWMLCSADVIRGRNVTSFFSMKDDMVNAGGKWQDKEVVRDGNIITSRNPNDLPAFCGAIIAALSETK
jgi:protease I